MREVRAWGCAPLTEAVECIADLFGYDKDAQNMYTQVNYYKDGDAIISAHQDHHWKEGGKMGVVYTCYGPPSEAV